VRAEKRIQILIRRGESDLDDLLSDVLLSFLENTHAGSRVKSDKENCFSRSNRLEQGRKIHARGGGVFLGRVLRRKRVLDEPG